MYIYVYEKRNPKPSVWRQGKDGQRGFVMEYLSHLVRRAREGYNTQPSLEKSLIRIG